MAKKNTSDKTITIRVPSYFFEKFKEACDENCETMSHNIRQHICGVVNLRHHNKSTHRYIDLHGNPVPETGYVAGTFETAPMPCVECGKTSACMIAGEDREWHLCKSCVDKMISEMEIREQGDE